VATLVHLVPKAETNPRFAVARAVQARGSVIDLSG
jgi:hypothetical protein